MASATLMSTHSAKRRQLTLLLACLFLLLLIAIAWLEFGSAKKAPQTIAEINSITIKRAAQPDIKLVKNGSNWNMTTPYQLAANAQRIEPLLMLGTANLDGYDKTEVDLPATGLNNPGASVIIGSREFQLGETDVDGDRRYTLVDNKVSFVPDWVWSLVHGGVSAFCDLSVFMQLPDSVYLIDHQQATKLANIDQWRTLQADKIDDWPEQTTTPLQASKSLFRLNSSDDPNSGESLGTLLRLRESTFIQTKPGFAYVISNKRLDALLNL